MATKLQAVVNGVLKLIGLFGTGNQISVTEGSGGLTLALTYRPIDTQEFTTAGNHTWTKPTANAPALVRVILVGGGGGGGSGRRGASGTIRGGGSGGAP